jgi:hypothetical protein
VHNNILVALKSLLGEVGAGYPLEILKINRETREILVATYPDYLVKLRQVYIYTVKFLVSSRSCAVAISKPRGFVNASIFVSYYFHR